MAAIARSFPGKVLLLAHRRELITQAAEKLKLYSPQADIGICKAEQNEINKDIVIGSVQSCSKRLEQLKEKDFSVLLIDEAHHAESPSYQKIIKELGFGDDKKLLVGVTATPQRADKKSLTNTFETVAYARTIGSLIKEGFLSAVVGRKVLTSFSLSDVKTKSGEFITKQLASAVNIDDRNQFIINKFKEHAAKRKAIAFCVNVKHAQDLAHAFQVNGIKAAAVWGLMPKEERESVLKQLKKGDIQVVTSCDLLTEGFDDETIDAIVMARPTKSKSLYIQMVGRGLRKHPTKNDCLVIDFTDTGNNLSGIMSLEQAVPEAEIIKQQSSNIEDDKTEPNFAYAERKAIDEEFDILGDKNFAWVQVCSQEWSLFDDDKNEIIVSEVNGGYVAHLFYRNGAVKKIVSKPLPLDWCIGTCEDYARANLSMKFGNVKSAWFMKAEPPTKHQRDFIQSKKPYVRPKNKADASMIIRKINAESSRRRRLRRN